VGRELTKHYEELVEQPITAWLAASQTRPSDKGEHVIIVMRSSRPEAPPGRQRSDEELLAEIGRMTDSRGLRPKEAAKQLAAKYGLSASAIYALHAKGRK
jgi:16S rRNA C1402 (ribose-2'-O) methylase RsmI